MTIARNPDRTVMQEYAIDPDEFLVRYGDYWKKAQDLYEQTKLRKVSELTMRQRRWLDKIEQQLDEGDE